MAAEPGPEGMRLPIIWVGVEDVPILFANQMVIQHSAENEFVLTFGQLTPL